MGLESRYRNDFNLTFLQDADVEDLETLANILMKDVDGNEQWTGELKKSIAEKITMYPKSKEEAYKASWKAIATEIQLFGGNTIVNAARRQGVEYEEILHDVAKRIKLDFHKDESILTIEEKVLRKLFGKVTTLDEIDFINEKLKKEGFLGLTSLKEKPWTTLKGNATSSPTRLLTTGAILLASTGFASLTGALAISSPAYRITIPTVCTIAMMRIKHEKNKEQFNEF